MLLKLVSHMDRARFRSDVISLTNFGTMAPLLVERGAQVRALGMTPGRPDVQKIGWLARRLRASRPDVLQTWTYQADLIGGLAGRCASGVPVIWGLRGGVDPGRSKLNTRVSARLCARLSEQIPTQILSCSQRLASDHVRMGYDPSKMVVIPNGFDTSVFKPDTAARTAVRLELGLDEECLLVGLVARYHAQKAHRSFLRAAAGLAQIQAGVHFVLVGEDVTTQNPELASLTGQLGLAGRCHFLGERLDMPRLTAAFDIAVSASEFGEGFSNAIGEAMSSGIPCVGTDVAETSLIIADTGRVVAPGQPDALADAMRDLLEMTSEARHTLGLLARKRIEERFGIAAVTAQYSDLYASVAAKGSDEH
jgi:glycosyltransferase involved in cell wall biosynthesis